MLPQVVYLSFPSDIDEDGTQHFKVKATHSPDVWGRVWNIPVIPNWELDTSNFPYTDWKSGGWASRECFLNLISEKEQL